MAFSVLVILFLGISHIFPSQGCGKSKSCFKWPLNCKTPSDCNIFVTYSFNSSDNTLDVEISGKISGWLAFGLNSKSRIMDANYGEVCYRYKGKVYLRGFKTIGHKFRLIYLDSGTVIDKNEYSNGILSCRYKRSVTGSYMKSLNEKWYLMSSWGKIQDRGTRPSVREHPVGGYFWSKDTVDLKKASDVQCTTFDWDMITIHGSLMIIAWVGFAASAVFYSRYMKIVWTNKTCAGQNIWFQLHRGFLIAAVILTVVGFIIILVEVKGINEVFLLHTALGFCVVIGGVLQTFVGIFRPKPSSRWRNTFIWSHWAFGNIALIFAAILIITGHYFMKASAAAMFIYITIIVLSFLVLEGRRYMKTQEDSKKFTQIIAEGRSQQQYVVEEAELEYQSSSSAKEQTVRKIVAFIVLGSGFVFAIIMVGLIASQRHSVINAGALS